MIIANPLYDTVFKYLMEDMEVAKGILSIILDVEITELAFKPQETVTEFAMIGKPTINIYRLDFVAAFKDKNGEQKKALIELQKTKRSTNILRFRRYLGENYQREDHIIINGKEVKQPLEIITIYFLGFELDDVPPAILKVKNCFIDVSTGKLLENAPSDKFIRLLNHESYTVQIPKLHPNTQSRVESVLDIFNQRYITDDDQRLDFKGDSQDPLAQKIIYRLTRAIVDDEMRRKMNMEEEYERDQVDALQRLEEQQQKIEKKQAEFEKQQTEFEKQQTELEKYKQETEKQQTEFEKQQTELEKQQTELEKYKQETEKQQTELEKKQTELEKYQTETEKYKQETEKKNQELEQNRQRTEEQNQLIELLKQQLSGKK